MRRREPRGTHAHPKSPLNLRLIFASFGLVSCAVLAVYSWRAGIRWLAVALAVLAVFAAVDLLVITPRVVRRRRRGERHSLFE